MPNAYYTFTPAFIPGTRVRSGDVNVQYSALETAFDNLPTAVDSMPRGTSTFATETGSGNAYAVAMPNTRLSNQDGDEVIFFATHGNTGNATLNVDTLGAVSMRDRAGVQIASGGITSGRLYIVTYDATNAYFVLDAAINVVTNIIDVVQGSGVGDPTAPGTFDADLEYQNSIGSVLANIGFNSDTDLSIINRVHGGSVVLQAEDTGGTVRTILTADPDAVTTLRGNTDLRLEVAAGEIALLAVANAETSLYYNNITRIGTAVSGRADIFSDGNTDIEERRLMFNYQDGSDRGYVGYTTSGALEIANQVHGANVAITAEDIGGTPKTILLADPDNTTTLRADTDLHLEVAAGQNAINATAGAGVDLYANNILRLAARNVGLVAIRSDTDTDTEARQIVFEHQDGTDRGYIGYVSDDVFSIANQIHGGNVEITGESAGGTLRQFFIADPDGTVLTRAVTNVEIQVGLSEIALLALANAQVTLYYNNIARLATAAGGSVFLRSDTSTTTENRQLIFELQDGTDAGRLGHSGDDIFAMRNEINGGNILIEADDAVGTARTILTGDPDALTTLRADTNLELQVAAGETALLATADADVALFYNDVEAARTKTPATGGFEVDNQQTGVGFERVLTESDGWNFKYKQGVDSKTNDTLEDDSELSGFTFEIDTIYEFQATLVFRSASSTPNVKWTFQLSQVSPNFSYQYSGVDEAQNLTADAVTTGGTEIPVVTIITGEEMIIHLTGWLRTHATLSTILDFQWAQNVTDGTAMVLASGSWMKFRKLGAA